MSNLLRTLNNERLKHAFVGSAFMLGAGIYSLFLQMSFPIIVPIILGAIMMMGSILMLNEEKEKIGGIILLIPCILTFSVLQDWIGSIVSDSYLDLGSERLNFGIIERGIMIALSTTGVSVALIGGIDGIAKKDFFLKEIEKLKIVHITCILNALFTTFALGWISFYLIIARNFWEALQFLPFFGIFLAIFFIGWWAINRRKAIWVIILGQTFCAFAYGFLSLLNPMYMMIVVLNILSNGAIITTTGPERFFHPKWRFKRNRIHNVAVPIVFAAIAGLAVIPYVYDWSDNPVMITVPSYENKNPNDTFEVVWAYGPEMAGNFDWIIQPNILNMLKQVNNLPGLNISFALSLVREIFHDPVLNITILDILNNLSSNGFRTILMPVVDASQVNAIFNTTGHSDEYIWDGNIDEFKEIYTEMIDWLYKGSTMGYDNVTKYYGIVVDLERTQDPDVDQLLMDYLAGPNDHIKGGNELEEFVEEIQSGYLNGQPHPIKPDGEFVAAAFFNFHAQDFMDFDDAQQQFFQISIVPPTQWEYIGCMVYQTGTGSMLSVYGYANQLNYHLGYKGVPYVNTGGSDVEELYKKFKIAKNIGLPLAGAWGLNELFSNGSNFIDGYDEYGTPEYDGAHEPEAWNESMFIQMHEMLVNNTGDPVEFEFDGWNSENTYEMLTLLLDVWLDSRWVYSTQPIIGTWTSNTYTLPWAITIISFIVIGIFTFYIAWDPYHRKNKKKERGTVSEVPAPKPSTNS